MADTAHEIYEFGPFQLDVGQRLLFRDGQLTAMAPKTLDTLLLLVKGGGQLVAKEELMRQIWPKTVVEESNLAIQVSQLRKILIQGMGVDPIATIPKRGYRFIAPIRLVTTMAIPQLEAANADAMGDADTMGDAGTDGRPEAESTSDAPRSGNQPAVGAAPTLPSPPPVVPPVPAKQRSGWLIAAVAVVVLLAGVGVLRWRGPGSRAAGAAATSVAPAAPAAATLLTDRDSVLLADLQNDTDEPIFASALRQALSIQLEQSPFLTLVSDQKIVRTLQQMQRAPTTALTPAISQEVCQRAGATAVIYSSVARLGSQYIVGLRAVNCTSGETLFDQQSTAAGKEGVLNALGVTATALRTRLGESLTQVQRYNTPIEQATTPSLQALEDYSTGWLMSYRKGDSAGSIAFFQHAIELDPNFAMAFAALGQAYSNLYEPGEAAQNLRRAYALRDRVSERERFYIESRYQRVVTGDLEQARQINQQWAQVYPRDALPHTSLALIDRYLGQYERALAESLEALRLSPDSAQSYANLAFSYIMLNRLVEARAVDDRALEKGFDSPLLHLDLYYLAWLQHDSAAADRLESGSVGQPGVEDRFLAFKAFNYAYAGQLAVASTLSQRAVAAARHSGAMETAAGYEADWAVIESWVGNAAQAQRAASAALQLSADRDSSYGAALAFALSGQSRRAAELITGLERDYPQDTAVQQCFVPTLRAAVALAQGDHVQAVQRLETTRPHELGKVTDLYPVYLRGLAQLAGGHPSAAILEFQRVIGEVGVVMNDPIGALARLQLARAYAAQGQGKQARAAYQEFLQLWRVADADTPVLSAAQHELAALK